MKLKKILTKLLGGTEVKRVDVVVPGYLRLYFDNERYLPKCQDMSKAEIVELFEEYLNKKMAEMPINYY